jgi:hypothetical protein
MNKAPFIDPEFTLVSANPAQPRGRTTAVRIFNDTTAGANPNVRLIVAADDLLDGQIHKNGVPSGEADLPATSVKAGTSVSVLVEVQAQGLVAISRAGWLPDCEIVHLLTLGTICPLDQTDATGKIPTNRRLYWKQVVPVPTVQYRIEFKVYGDGYITWQDDIRGVSGRFELGLVGKQDKQLHIVLLTRNGETGSISLPLFGPDTQLKLV